MNTFLGLSGITGAGSFPVPMSSWMLALLALALCLVGARYKLGLACACGGFLYWGYEANRSGILNFIQNSSVGMLTAIGVGLLLSLLAMSLLLQENHE